MKLARVFTKSGVVQSVIVADSETELEFELLYQHRSQWPKEIVDKFHAFHLKMGTTNPNCPHCLSPDLATSSRV